MKTIATLLLGSSLLGNPFIIIIGAIVVIAVVIAIIGLLILRGGGKSKKGANAAPGGAPEWQRQGQQAAPGGWNQQAQATDNPWGQPAQQAGAWGMQGSQQPAQQQPAWGQQSNAPMVPQEPTTLFGGTDVDRTMMACNTGPQNRLGIVRVEEGKEPGRIYELRKDSLSIGRSRESDIFVEDLAVSRLHASIVNMGNGNYSLKDEGSANGTKVNGKLVTKYQTYPLQEGDKIQLGRTVLVLGQTSVQPNQSADSWAPPLAQQPQSAQQGPLPLASQPQPPGFFPAVSSPAAIPWQQQSAPGTKGFDPGGGDSTTFYGGPEADRTVSRNTGQESQPLEAPSPQGRTDVRYSDVSFPSHTVIGRMEALRVAITRKAVNTWAVPLALERSSDDTQPMKVDAYVVVSPLDFDLESSNVQTITVFPNADSAPVLFKLVAKSEGGKTIALEFFQNAYYLGRAELETTVSQQAQVPHLVSVQALLEMSATQLPPDLTILFDRVPVGNDRHYYRYRLLSPIRELNLWFDEFRSPETNVTPQGFLEETFTQLNRMLSGDTPSEFFFGRLNSIGMSLYRRLFSDDFKRLYWNSLRSKVKTIVIISFEPWIPWELVRPFNHETNEADDGFLCEKFNLTRWLAGAGFPDTISLEQLGLIVSTSSLDSAKLEAEEIKKLLGSKARDILSSSPSVYRLLRTNDLYGLHFACHGSFNKDNPDMSTLSLEDGTWLSPIDIDGDGLTFGKNRPLVFLNACETGQGGYALTGMGGWAEAFVGRARCCGLIGSIWKAKDESACKFAVAFYRNLLDGKTISEAARLARLSIKQTGDPTWLSYTVYANPLAHLVIDRW
jgi:hypothetical protein